MKDLLVIYDDEIKDKGRDSYLNAIKREIPSARFFDINENTIIENISKVLFLKPLDEKTAKNAEKLLKNCPDYDIEGIYTNQLTITAEAILRVIGEVKDKKVVVLNQSDVLGKPLAKELINRGANVFSVNSSFDGIFWAFRYILPDILISASGDEEFTILETFVSKIKTIVDLSDDVECENKITSIPTIEVLKDRLR